MDHNLSDEVKDREHGGISNPALRSLKRTGNRLQLSFPLKNRDPVTLSVEGAIGVVTVVIVLGMIAARALGLV